MLFMSGQVVLFVFSNTLRHRADFCRKRERGGGGGGGGLEGGREREREKREREREREREKLLMLAKLLPAFPSHIHF